MEKKGGDNRQHELSSASNLDPKGPTLLDNAERTLKSVISDLSFHGGIQPFTKSKIRIGYLWLARLIKRGFSYGTDPSVVFRNLLEAYPYSYGTSLFMGGYLPFKPVEAQIVAPGVPHGVTVILGDSGSGKTELLESSSIIDSIIYSAEPQKSLYSTAHEAFSMLLIALLYSFLWEADYTSDLQKLIAKTGLVRRQAVDVSSGNSVIERNQILNSELISLNESVFDVSHDDSEVFAEILLQHFPRILGNVGLDSKDEAVREKSRLVSAELFNRVIPPHFFNAVEGKLLAIDSMRDFLAGVGSDALTQGGISLRSVSDLTQFSQILLVHQIPLISTLNLNTKHPQIRDSMTHMVRSSVAGFLDISVDPSTISYRGISKDRLSIRGGRSSPFTSTRKRILPDDGEGHSPPQSTPAVDFFSLYPDFTI